MNWIEITTRIGCENMCSYCPQTKFLNAYKDDKRLMTLQDFELYLSKVPKDIQIHFSGFSEALFNLDSMQMMKSAYEKGYQVVLYTTLEGNPDYSQLKGVEFEEIHIHLYPRHVRAKVDVRLEKLLFFAKCKKLFYDSISTPVSRAGNNWEMPRKTGKLVCQRFDCNVLLPNGDVYLCCSDWGLQHKIGSLKIHTYDSKQFEKERNILRKKAASKNDEVLCRYCEMAKQVEK